MSDAETKNYTTSKLALTKWYDKLIFITTFPLILLPTDFFSSYKFCETCRIGAAWEPKS